jgi:hypothetical protein
MDLISKLEDLKNFGIDLKLDSKEMEVFYVRSMKYFFDEKEHVYCTMVTDRELTVSDDHGDLATLYIKDSTLRIVPLDENPYAVVMDVLEFVANLHKPTVALYREMYGESKVTDPFSGIRENVKEDSEEDSDSDDEWI